MNIMFKKTYISPELTIVSVAAERGFAGSDTTFAIMRDQALELSLDFNPVKGYEEVSGCGNPFNSSDPSTPPPSNNFWNF